MKLMCLNGWGGRLHADLVAYLRASRPDVLCLQEVVHTPHAQKDWLTYRDTGIELPQRARFFDDVCAALPDHVATFCPAAQGDLWDGQEPVASQWGLATFVHRALPVIGQAQRFVHKQFSARGYGDHPRSRNAHAVRIHDPGRDRCMTIAHMHGLRDLDGKHDTPERLAQAERLRDLVVSVAEPTDETVVCGDFNVLPGSATFDVLAGIGMRDLVTARGFTSTRTAQYRKPGTFADYMLVNAPLRDARFDVITEPEVSDHCPLVLTIEGPGTP